MTIKYLGIKTECEAKALPKGYQIHFVGFKRNTKRTIRLYECIAVYEDKYTYGKKNLRELHEFFTGDFE